MPQPSGWVHTPAGLVVLTALLGLLTQTVTAVIARALPPPPVVDTRPPPPTVVVVVVIEHVPTMQQSEHRKAAAPRLKTKRSR